MLKKVIKYKDFDGIDREEPFYFNLTKAECIEMELSTHDGLEKLLDRIVEAKDNRMILEVFKDIVMRAYGEKSEDGRRFYKSKEISASFAATEAYSELLIELCNSADAASAFINGIIPQVEGQAPVTPDSLKPV